MKKIQNLIDKDPMWGIVFIYGIGGFLAVVGTIVAFSLK